MFKVVVKILVFCPYVTHCSTLVSPSGTPIGCILLISLKNVFRVALCYRRVTLAHTPCNKRDTNLRKNEARKKQKTLKKSVKLTKLQR